MAAEAPEGGLAVGTLPPKTYAEYYRTCTAFEGDYLGVMAPYAIALDHEGPVGGEKLA